MAYLDVNPAYTSLLHQQGLHGPEDFLRLPGIIICGHPDRNVSRVTLGTGGDGVRAFLKKEHRVPWRDRLANAWVGFGWRSKSCREMALFRMLREEGLDCPEAIAAGEVEGKAFILLREVDGAVDLRCTLEQLTSTDRRRRLARELGAALARIHAAGFDQPDLYSKHVLVEDRAGTNRFWFLDWQRSQKHRRLAVLVRCRDLAALDATLSEELATDRERLACLRAYVQATARRSQIRRRLFAMLGRRIRSHAERLLRRRHVRELRQAPLRPRQQSLIWLDGEAICVTPQFHAEMGPRLQVWMKVFRAPAGVRTTVDRRTVSLTAERTGYLVRRRETRRWRWLWDWLRGKRPETTELKQAGILFRLERYGIALPRLLAMGQRHRRPWHAESFLLTEAVAGRVDLLQWLEFQTSEPGQRQRMLRQAGELLRRVHQAGYYFDALMNPARAFVVQMNAGNQPEAALASVDGLRRSRAACSEWAREDLDRLRAALSPVCTGEELRRFCMSYLGKRRLDADALLGSQRVTATR
jgi:tRNA A-37 threonylcarbamoyl transferase component Bud32